MKNPEVIALEQAIEGWLKNQEAEQFGIPDFWNECDTTASLAEWLAEQGFRKVKA